MAAGEWPWQIAAFDSPAVIQTGRLMLMLRVVVPPHDRQPSRVVIIFPLLPI